MLARLPLRWGGRPPAFQSVDYHRAVPWPERFRGGCAFGGAGPKPDTLSRAIIPRLPGGDGASLGRLAESSQSSGGKTIRKRTVARLLIHLGDSPQDRVAFG